VKYRGGEGSSKPRVVAALGSRLWNDVNLAARKDMGSLHSLDLSRVGLAAQLSATWSIAVARECIGVHNNVSVR
jgi:hypothetical protein